MHIAASGDAMEALNQKVEVLKAKLATHEGLQQEAQATMVQNIGMDIAREIAQTQTDLYNLYKECERQVNGLNEKVRVLEVKGEGSKGKSEGHSLVNMEHCTPDMLKDHKDSGLGDQM